MGLKVQILTPLSSFPPHTKLKFLGCSLRPKEKLLDSLENSGQKFSPFNSQSFKKNIFPNFFLIDSRKFQQKKLKFLIKQKPNIILTVTDINISKKRKTKKKYFKRKLIN